MAFWIQAESSVLHFTDDRWMMDDGRTRRMIGLHKGELGVWMSGGRR